MWLSKSSKFSRDDVKNSQSIPSASGSPQQSQHKKSGLSSQKRRREAHRDKEHTGLQSYEKPSPAKKTKVAISSYEDEVSDDEFVVIELFSSDEQEAGSTYEKKSNKKSVSKTSLSQEKKAQVDSVETASDFQVSPIYNTTSIFKRFQNRNEARGNKGKTGPVCGYNSGPMFTQQEMDTDLPLLPWPKKRGRHLSQSSNSNQSASSQSPKRTGIQANSVSQFVKGVISNISEDSSSDSEEPFVSKLKKKMLPESKLSVGNSRCQDDSSEVSQATPIQSTEMKKIRQPSPEVSPVFMSLRTMKKEKSGHVSSDSFADFVVVETASENSSEDNRQREESDASDGFDTTSRKSGYLLKHSTKRVSQNMESSKSKSELGSTCNSVRIQTKGGSKKKKGRKSFQLTSSDSEDNFSSSKVSSSNKYVSCSAKTQKSCKLETFSKKSVQTTSLYYSDDDISCHSTATSGEETYDSQLKYKPQSDEETEEYHYDDQLGTRAGSVIPNLSLIVSKSSKKKLKKIASHSVENQTDDDESTEAYVYEDNVNENMIQNTLSSQSSLAGRKKDASIKKTIDEKSLELKVADSNEDMTQAPDTYFDSQEGDDRDVLEIGLDEDLTQPLNSPVLDEDGELTEVYSQSVYGNPPQLSVAGRTQSFVSRRAGSVLDLEEPPQLTQQISKPTEVTCVSPASTEAYDSDTCHSNKTETFPDYDHQDIKKKLPKSIKSRSGGSSDSNGSESCLMFKQNSKSVLKRTDNRSGGSTDSNGSESCLIFKLKSESVLKRTDSRSSESTNSSATENYQKSNLVFNFPVNGDHMSVSENEPKMSKIYTFTDDQVCDNEMSIPKLQDMGEKADNDMHQTEVRELEPVHGIQSKVSASKLSLSKSVMFNLDMPVEIKKETFEDTSLKIKEEKLAIEQVTELQCKLPCYTQEEDVIFVYDSSDDEALIDLSQTNIRSDHLSDTDSMYGMFDHSDTELFDDDFSNDITLVSEGRGDGKMALEDIAVEEKNPFNRLGESDSEDVKVRTEKSKKQKRGKGTFNLDIDDSEEPKTSQVCSKKHKKPCALEISSDSDINEPVPAPKSPLETSGHDSFDMDLDDDVYLAAESHELLDPKERKSDIFSAETQIQTMSDFKQMQIESDSSLFSALTEVTTTDSDTDVKEIQPRKPGFCTSIKNLSSKLKNLSAEVDPDIKRKKNRSSADMKSDTTLSDEDLYEAATQIDSNISAVLKEKHMRQAPKNVDAKLEDMTIIPSLKNTDYGVGWQGKPKRKTASVMSLMMSSLKKDFKTPSVSTPVSLNKSEPSNKNILEVNTQNFAMGSSSLSVDPFKTSTPKITEGRPNSSPIFQLRKLNFQEMYEPKTQSIPSSNEDMTFQKQINLDDSNDEPDDDALYKALDDLEETDLSYLDTTKQNQNHKENCDHNVEIPHNSGQETGNNCSLQKDNSTDCILNSHQEDVFIAATQIDPLVLRSCISDSESEGLPEVTDCIKPMDRASDEDPFSVMTQVDEASPAKNVESTCPSKASAAKSKVPEVLLKKIKSNHMRRKCIMVTPEKLKKSVLMKKGNSETMKDNSTSNSLKVVNTAGKSPCVYKKKSPVSRKKGAAADNKKKLKQKSEFSFSLTQKIQAAKECQKKRKSKPAVDPSMPTAKMRPAALHASNSDVLPPDEEEIMAKGLPLLTFTKLVNKQKHDKSEVGESMFERKKQGDMEVDDSGSVVAESVPIQATSSPSGVDRTKLLGKDKHKKQSKHSPPSNFSRSGNKHSASSKLQNNLDVSKHSSKLAKHNGPHQSAGSSKSSSSLSKSHHRHSSSASKKVSSHSSSGSSKSTTDSSKHTCTSSKSSVSSQPKSSSSSVSKTSSKVASSLSTSSRASDILSHSPTYSSERRTLLPKEYGVPTRPKMEGDQTNLHKSELESYSHSAPTSKTTASAASVPEETSVSASTETKDKSFDLTLYPLPAVVKCLGKVSMTTRSPQLGSEPEIRSPVKMNAGCRQLDTTLTSSKATVQQPALKISDHSSLHSTPSPAHHTKKLNDNDSRITVQKQQVSMVQPVSKTGQPLVSRDPRVKSTTATFHAQRPNLLLKPSAIVHPEGALYRPFIGHRAVDTILPFSQMLRGNVAQPNMREGTTVVKEVKDPSKLMESTHYLSKVLCWNPVWLGEQNKPEFAGIPPPILQKDESVYPLLESYTSLEDYQTIMTRLLFLETWDMIFKEWKQKKTKTYTNMMFVSVDICNKQDKGGLSKFIWQGVLTREQFRRSQYPMEGDMITMNVWGAPLSSTKDNRSIDVQPSWKAQFGYVERMNIRPTSNIHNLFRTYPVLKSTVENKHGEFHILTLTALGRYRKFKPIGDRLMTIEPLCHMVTARRQFQALTYLPRSPLLRDILHPSNHQVFHHNTLIHDNSLLKAYNPSQAQAISAVCHAVREPAHMPRICLLQGPPGTGKTHTITGIITRIIQESGGKCCICLCTPSNGAADELMRRLIAIRNNGGRNASMRLVRFGKTKSIHDSVLECAYDELVEKERKKEEDHKRRDLSSLPESVKREQQQLKQKIQRVQKELASLSVTANKIQADRRQTDLRNFERELRYLDKQQSTTHQVVQLTTVEETRIRQRVLQDAHVICSTLNSMGSARIMNILRMERNRNPFLCAIIDEATQSTELDCLIPLQYGVSKLVLVGDPEQLPPTILSQRAKEMKFGLSLFERFYTYFKSKDQTAVMMLRTQYRMDPAILAFPNLYIYDGQLNTDRSVTERTKNFPLHPYLVLNIESGQETISSEGSVSNQTEADCVAELCQLIVSRTKISPSRIGVICPYQSQRSLVINSLSNKHLRDVDVGTVDGFQGREKHVIIMSCVRARSLDGSIGFLSNRRRMNVALTRAKYALYVLGHLDTLKRGPDWRALIDDAQRRSVIVNVPSVNQFSTVAAQCFKAHKPSR